MPKPQTLGQRLAQKRREKAAREHRDITQLDVAKAAEVSKGAVSRYESDVDKPRDAVLERIAAFLDTTPAYLRYGVNEPALPTNEELADMTGATATKPRTLSLQDLEREAAAKRAGKKGGGRRA